MTSPRAESRTERAERAASGRPLSPDPLIRFVFLAALLALPASAQSGDVRIVDAKAHCVSNTCRFDVTLKHADTGWEHYADEWRVVGPGGEVFGVRTLLHPHVNEQPFTRSLSGVVIPEDVDRVIIEARDTVHGFSDHQFELELTAQ